MRKVQIRSIIAFIFFTTGTISYGQDYVFRVVSMKGTTQVRKADEWVKLKAGAELTAEDSIKIGDNSVLGLVHIDGRPLQLHFPGTFKISDIRSKKTPRLRKKKVGG